MTTSYRHAALPNKSHLATISQQFHDLGLAERLLTEPRAKLTHADDLALAAIRQPATIANHAAGVAQQLADGTITVEAGVDMVAGTQAHSAAIDSVTSTLRGAAKIAERQAIESFRKIGDQLIVELDRAVREAATQAGALAGKVEGIVDDRDAIRAGKPTAAAWTTLTSISDRVDSIRAAADMLRRYRIAVIEHHPDYDVDTETMRYARPWAVDTEAQRGGHEVRRLLESLPADLVERTYSEWLDAIPEAVEAYQAIADAHAAEKRGERDRVRHVVAELNARSNERAEARWNAEVA